MRDKPVKKGVDYGGDDDDDDEEEEWELEDKEKQKEMVKILSFFF